MSRYNVKQHSFFITVSISSLSAQLGGPDKISIASGGSLIPACIQWRLETHCGCRSWGRDVNRPLEVTAASPSSPHHLISLSQLFFPAVPTCEAFLLNPVPPKVIKPLPSLLGPHNIFNKDEGGLACSLGRPCFAEHQ